MTRALSAAALVAVLVVAVWFGPPSATLALGVLIAALASGELVTLGGAPPRSLAVVMAALVAASVTTAFTFGDPLATQPIAGSLSHSTTLVAVLLAAVILAGLVSLAGMAPSSSAIPTAALTFMAPMYVGLPIGVLVWIDAVYGREALLLPIAIVAASDTAQYYSGRAFGRRQLAPAVSPAKTVEGAIGGLVAAAVVAALVAPRWLSAVATPAGRVSTLVAAGLGAMLALAGMLGDLFESFLKRSAGVKDSSALIPGHGGVLDRVDSHLFAAPLYYLFLRYLA
jgi:phosphatidate cytidylyltransferase